MADDKLPSPGFFEKHRDKIVIRKRWGHVS